MKRFGLLALLLTVAVTVVGQNSTSAWISDSDSFTNLRSAPHGTVVLTLPDTCTYMIGITNPRDGWWQVEWIEGAEEAADIPLVGSPTGKYWIHYSVLAFSTRNYGSKRWCLRATPSKKGKPVYWFSDETIARPLDVKGDWHQVKIGNHTGWIESEMICSNPLTTCP